MNSHNISFYRELKKIILEIIKCQMSSHANFHRGANVRGAHICVLQLITTSHVFETSSRISLEAKATANARITVRIAE